MSSWTVTKNHVSDSFPTPHSLSKDYVFIPTAFHCAIMVVQGSQDGL